MGAWRHFLVLMFVGAACCLAQARQLAVVTDAANPVSDLTAAELVKIFNARTQTWPDGKAIKVVVRDSDSAEMRLVFRKLLAMAPEQAQAFVQSHSSFFVVASSDEAILRFVSSTRGAIGIVDLFSITKDVKVLKVDGKLPVEPGYVLRGSSQ